MSQDKTVRMALGGPDGQWSQGSSRTAGDQKDHKKHQLSGKWKLSAATLLTISAQHLHKWQGKYSRHFHSLVAMSGISVWDSSWKKQSGVEYRTESTCAEGILGWNEITGQANWG